MEYFTHFSPFDRRQGVPFVNIKSKMVQKLAIKVDTSEPTICKLELDDNIICTYQRPKIDTKEDEGGYPL